MSFLVQADSPDKALTIIDELKNNKDMTAEDLATVKEIEQEMKETFDNLCGANTSDA